MLMADISRRFCETGPRLERAVLGCRSVLDLLEAAAGLRPCLLQHRRRIVCACGQGL